MRMREKFRYLSNRVLAFGILFTVLLAVSGIAQLTFSLAGGCPVLPGLLTVLCGIAAAVAAWCAVVRPYRASERMVRRFLEGYLLQPEDLDRVFLTPMTRKQIEKLDQIFRSPQLMDLNKRQAEYLALQNQINPHFLYNTLESIRGEALIAGLDGVADMTEALAKFFRYTITKVENLVSVEEELDNAETYFWIQKYRFGDRLQLHIEYDPDEWEDIMNCRIPKLTLQPILENGIIHGTELKIGQGNLRIRFKKTESRLVICISDDGVGMDEETLASLNAKLGKSQDLLVQTHQEEEKQGGIALANVNNRIRLIFGDEYGMHVYSVKNSGTDVEISIPAVTKLEV